MISSPRATALPPTLPPAPLTPALSEVPRPNRAVATPEDTWVAPLSAQPAPASIPARPINEPGPLFPADGISEEPGDDTTTYAWYIPFRIAAFFKANLITAVIAAKRLKANVALLTQGSPKPVEIVNFNDVPGVQNVRPEEEADFLKYRSPLYSTVATTGVAWQDALSKAGRQGIKLASDAQLRKMILHTPVSHGLPLDPNDPTSYLLDLSDQFKITTKDATRYQVKAVRIPVNPTSAARASIELDNGKVLHQPAEGESSPEWNLAKLYFQMSWAHAGVGLFHTWVHFGVPDVAAASLTNGVIDGSVEEGGALHSLLAPHLRFTMRINNQALHVGRFSAEEPLKIAHQEFTKTIAKRVVEEEIVVPRELNSSSPYEYFLDQYRAPIQEFVTSIAPEIDPQEYQSWLAPLAKRYPGLADASMVQVLTHLLWQVSVVHSSDHHAAYKFRNYGVSTIGQDFNDATPEQLNDLASLVDPGATANFRTAVDIFARHPNQHPDLDNRTVSGSYAFKTEGASQAVDQFRSALKSTDQKMANEGFQFCPVSTMLQSVCF